MEVVTLLLSAVLIALAFAAYFVMGNSTSKTAPAALNEREYQPFKLTSRTQVTGNTVLFRFALPAANMRVGLPVGQHMMLRCKDAEGKTISRAYTPVSSDQDLGYFDLLVKLYPQGKMSQHLQALQVGENVEARGPTGHLEYKGAGSFTIMRRIPGATGSEPITRTYTDVGMIAGGSGITPMLQLLRDISRRAENDRTNVSLLFANVTEADILLRSELDTLAESRPATRVHYTLDRPAEGWTGGSGFVTPDMIKAQLPAPGPNALVLLCGPKPMVDMMEKHLQLLGYTEDQYFKF